MKVAVVGAGAAGLAAARALAGRCEVTLIEAAARPGGHVHTVDVDGPRGPVAVDLGFIVCHRATYPRLFAILDELGVETRPTSMTFSVRAGGVEWGSASLRSALAGGARWRFLARVIRFLRQARRDAGGPLAAHATLDEYLAARRVDAEVRDGLVIPLAAALWSMPPEDCGAFPARTWLGFLDHHGMLRPDDQHGWRTIRGGSRRWVDALLARLPVTLWTGAPVRAVAPDGAGLAVDVDGRVHRFDRVVLATHADDALALLAAPTEAQRRVLGAFSYGDNRVVLHGDPSYLPRATAARASWNFAAGRGVTYWMNRLQGLPDDALLLVTLDPSRALPVRDVLYETRMRHPRFDRAALAAQAELPRLQGQGGVYLAGAHHGFGFHEDAIVAGEEAAARLLAST